MSEREKKKKLKHKIVAHSTLSKLAKIRSNMYLIYVYTDTDIDSVIYIYYVYMQSVCENTPNHTLTHVQSLFHTHTHAILVYICIYAHRDTYAELHKHTRTGACMRVFVVFKMYKCAHHYQDCFEYRSYG